MITHHHHQQNTLFTPFEKSNFCPKIQFWQNPNIFTSFSSKFFSTNFLVKSKLSTAQKSKTTTFSRVFYPNKIDNILGKSKLNFWTKNEDFEHCAFKNRLLELLVHKLFWALEYLMQICNFDDLIKQLFLACFNKFCWEFKEPYVIFCAWRTDLKSQICSLCDGSILKRLRTDAFHVVRTIRRRR